MRSQVLEEHRSRTISVSTFISALANQRRSKERKQGLMVVMRGREASGCAGGFVVAMFPVRPHEPDNGGQQHHLYPHVEAMKDLFETRIRFPRAAQPHTYVCQGKAPRPGAEEGVD